MVYCATIYASTSYSRCFLRDEGLRTVGPSVFAASADLRTSVAFFMQAIA